MQKKKFTQTDTFKIGTAIAQGTAFIAGLTLGMAVVEVAVRKIMK